MVGEAKNKIIVESLIDGKKYPAFSNEKISSLKEISIYTESDDVPLEDVLVSIYKVMGGKPVDNPKKMSSNKLKELFEKALPEYDKDAVYVSNMKSIFNWYNILLDKDLITIEEEDNSGEDNSKDSDKKEEDNTNN